MNAQPQNEFAIRRMEMQDIADALKIEHQSFPTPWSSAMFVLELSKAGSVCLAATDDDILIGYMIAARYAQVWHIMNVSVDPANRRGGVGSAMMNELFRIADRERTHYTL